MIPEKPWVRLHVNHDTLQEISNQLSKEINSFFQKFNTNIKLCLLQPAN